MKRILFVNLRTKFHMSVACPAGSPLSGALASIDTGSYGLPKPPNHAYLSFRGLAYWLKTSCRLLRIALTTNPDLIHANSLLAGTASILAVVVTGKKLLLHARDLAHFGSFSRFCCWLCERVIAVSHAVKDTLVERGVSPDKIKVVHNGVESIYFDQIDESEAPFAMPPSRENHTPVFAHVGQFVPWKNHIAFLKAASHVASQLPEARFAIVGDDIFGRDSAYKSSLLSYAGNSAIAERISFLGWQEDMHKVWPKIGCLVHTADREPFGRVIIEAMAYRIPVIAIANCGPSEIVENGKTGILVDANNIEALSKAMLKIALDTQFARELAAAAYDRAMSNFRADETAARIKEIYDEMLAA
jgi:glycosyltransferase involved in cell wall biosynthesis